MFPRRIGAADVSLENSHRHNSPIEKRIGSANGDALIYQVLHLIHNNYH
jgi:hypothetical protein